jgi:hypothetical protein
MMDYNYIPTSKFKKSFKRLLKKYASLIADFEKFMEDFAENPAMGDPLGNGFRKIRLAVKAKNKGKSGGARIIIYHFLLKQERQDVLLIDIYDKSEVSTMQDMEYLRIAKQYFEENE